ncbi:FYVE_zinc finger domain-containing protein [Hexamita inflata]|uniref:FYVE zinc finger domain-containing protein n=1 Tax=Hexamita inflata TaxID=28002 RepID=A0AA86TPM5_9EUKA|nr:FYVE zinc finger domain-containing protein [Hexamita inflata]
MSDIVKYDDYLRTGIDPNPYLTQPLDEIMHSSDWAPDSSDDVCQMCYCKFTLFNRRHHCRCCGQLYCAKCCPPSDDIRLCVLCCFSFISADPENQPKTMEDFCKFDAVNEILAAYLVTKFKSEQFSSSLVFRRRDFVCCKRYNNFAVKNEVIENKGVSESELRSYCRGQGNTLIVI